MSATDALSLTELRRELFRHVDQAIETGRPLLVKRKGRTIAFKPEIVEQEPAADRWARYDAWIAERRARGEIPTLTEAEEAALEAEQDRIEAEVKAAMWAEIEAEWDEFYGPEKSAA